MPSIHDYLDWRGDVPATADNINEIDNMIFCLLSYIDFEKVFENRPQNQTITLRDAAKEYFFAYDDKKPYPLGLIVPPEIIHLFRRLAETPRYQDLELFGYVNEICQDREMQFSAITIKIPDRGLFVAFRGTDDSLVGWKEDFKLSYMDEVPAQSKATAYLNALRVTKTTTLYVGGHSKGGNLAVWAATHVKKETQDRIRRVFSNDGPGFSEIMLKSNAYLQLSERVTYLIPQSSLVGLLLDNDGRYQIVKSRALGVLQHNGLTWEVMGSSFVRQDKLTSRGVRHDTVIRERIGRMKREEKQAFAEMFFEVLSATGATTLTELAEKAHRNTLTMFKTFQAFDKEKKEMAFYLMGKLFNVRVVAKKEMPQPSLEIPIPQPSTPVKAPSLSRPRVCVEFPWLSYFKSFKPKKDRLH